MAYPWHGIQLLWTPGWTTGGGGAKENDDVQDAERRVCGSKNKCQVGHAKGNREKTRKPKPNPNQKNNQEKSKIHRVKATA
jgi:hypothetical protein